MTETEEPIDYYSLLVDRLSKRSPVSDPAWAEYRKLCDPTTPLTELPKEHLPTAVQVRRSLIMAYVQTARDVILAQPEKREGVLSLRPTDSDLLECVKHELSEKGYECVSEETVITIRW